MHTHTRTHTYTCTHARTHTRTHTDARTHMHAHAHTHTQTRAHTHTDTRTHTHMHAHTNTQTRAHTHYIMMSPFPQTLNHTSSPPFSSLPPPSPQTSTSWDRIHSASCSRHLPHHLAFSSLKSSHTEQSEHTRGDNHDRSHITKNEEYIIYRPWSNHIQPPFIITDHYIHIRQFKDQLCAYHYQTCEHLGNFESHDGHTYQHTTHKQVCPHILQPTCATSPEEQEVGGQSTRTVVSWFLA